MELTFATARALLCGCVQYLSTEEVYWRRRRRQAMVNKSCRECKQRHPTRYRYARVEYDAKYRGAMSDSYIKGVLLRPGLTSEDIPDSLVEAWREQLRLKRVLWAANKAQT